MTLSAQIQRRPRALAFLAVLAACLPVMPCAAATKPPPPPSRSAPHPASSAAPRQMGMPAQQQPHALTRLSAPAPERGRGEMQLHTSTRPAEPVRGSGAMQRSQRAAVSASPRRAPVARPPEHFANHPGHPPDTHMAREAPPSPRPHVEAPGARRDVRVGGAAVRTQGLERGLAIARALPPRPFLRLPAHRDLASERAFLARHAADFHTRLVRDFDARELGLWRAGLWRNEWHYGRRGWWWEADGAWYAYPQPLLPYPDEVAVAVVYETPILDGPDVTAQEVDPTLPVDPAASPADSAAPAADAAPAGPLAVALPPNTGIPPLPPAPVGWYRCYAPSGVFPGVQSCGMTWELVQTAPLPGEL